jgi:Tfp pilus assembly protein PilP
VYSYNPEGRRDPFVSLLLRGAELNVSRENRPDGSGGVMIGEITVRGIVKNRNAYVAMVQGPDKKTYIIHTGDKMLDGAVKAITGDAVVFAQDVNDPLSLVKQREVRKTLRVPEEGK